MEIKHFYDPITYTLTYLIYDSQSKDAVIIDPVWDFDIITGKLDDKNFQKVFVFTKELSLNVRAILETHAHADHVSSSQNFKKYFPNSMVGISEHIQVVQKEFKKYFNLSDLKIDGSQFDLLLKDNQIISFGSLQMKAIPTPGHTPACMSFLFQDALFSGDTIFMPDYGTGRCDFPGGSAKALYQSITKNLYSLPEKTRVFVGHDYCPNNRSMKYESTIKENKESNIHLSRDTSEESFVKFRESRDKTLNSPKLLLPSIQLNINAGKLPTPENNHISYLKIPISITNG